MDIKATNYMIFFDNPTPWILKATEIRFIFKTFITDFSINLNQINLNINYSIYISDKLKDFLDESLFLKYEKILSKWAYNKVSLEEKTRSYENNFLLYLQSRIVKRYFNTRNLFYLLI